MFLPNIERNKKESRLRIRKLTKKQETNLRKEKEPTITIEN